MRTIAIFIAAWLCYTAASAQQKTEKNISFAGKESVELNIQIADSIELHTWNRNEILVSASVNINENKDNDAYQISFGETGKMVDISANFKKDYFKGKNNCCNKSDIRWKIFVPEKAYFSIETINGNITIAGSTQGMNVKSISGFIDLAVPENRQADIEFSTIAGTVYSNHSLAPSDISSRSHSVIKEKLNNGGQLIKLETISGDIFFRKSI
jgi:hypothetical protein